MKHPLTAPHDYLVEKLKRMISSLAEALTCRQTPKSRKYIEIALYDAAKLLKFELEQVTGRKFDSLHERIAREVVEQAKSGPKEPGLLCVAADQYLHDTVVACLREEPFPPGKP